MEKASVSVRGKAAPMVALLATVFAVLLVAPVAIQKVSGEKGFASKKAVAIEGEAVYADYALATKLLREGKPDAASRIIDSHQEASLEVAVNATTTGPLASMSSVSLLLALGKEIAAEADRAAGTGNRSRAEAWLGRGRMLTHQALGSSIRTLEALQLAGSLDRLSLETRARILSHLGDSEAARKQKERVAAFDRYWRNTILSAVRDMREANNIFRLRLLNGKFVNVEEIERRERAFAVEITARYLRDRRRMQIS